MWYTNLHFKFTITIFSRRERNKINKNWEERKKYMEIVRNRMFSTVFFFSRSTKEIGKKKIYSFYR